jgi:hypothetical protein
MRNVYKLVVLKHNIKRTFRKHGLRFEDNINKNFKGEYVNVLSFQLAPDRLGCSKHIGAFLIPVNCSG